VSRGRAQARSIGGLVASLLVIVAGFLLAPSARVSADPSGSCSTTSSFGEPCTPDPILTTSTTVEVPTTSEDTTSTAQATSTTVRRTTTTARSQLGTSPSTTAVTTPARARLLIPGDGTEGAELTTTTEGSVTRVGNGGPSDGTLIALVVVGLVLIAGVVGVLTWRYWVATQPPLIDSDRTSPAAG